MLDCHDGIPVRPDLEGILAPDEMLRLADSSPRARRQHQPHPVADRTPPTASMCTSSTSPTSRRLGEDEDRYVAARAIQLFARGSRRSTTSGLLAGSNDHDAVAATGEGRAINRHDYSRPRSRRRLARPVVQRLLSLIRLRNSHPAFRGELTVTGTGQLDPDAMGSSLMVFANSTPTSAQERVRSAPAAQAG